MFTRGTPSGTPSGTPVAAPVTFKEIGIPLGHGHPRVARQGSEFGSQQSGRPFHSVQSNLNGDAEFPIGTKFTSSIIGVQKATASQPGMLDLSFTQALLPDGRRVRITGSLISLDDQSVTRTADGRVVAKVAPTDNNRLKMIGIGAGAGVIIGKPLDKNLIVGGLLGAAAGYLYDQYRTNDAAPTDVAVSVGTVFGVRMDRGIRYEAPEAFVTARSTYRSTH